MEVISSIITVSLRQQGVVTGLTSIRQSSWSFSFSRCSLLARSDCWREDSGLAPASPWCCNCAVCCAGLAWFAATYQTLSFCFHLPINERETPWSLLHYNEIATGFCTKLPSLGKQALAIILHLNLRKQPSASYFL